MAIKAVKLFISDISFFEKSIREDNDLYNKKRELIIYGILKNTVPSYFFNDSR
jgi:hypothetical protein